MRSSTCTGSTGAGAAGLGAAAFAGLAFAGLLPAGLGPAGFAFPDTPRAGLGFAAPPWFRAGSFEGRRCCGSGLCDFMVWLN